MINSTGRQLPESTSGRDSTMFRRPTRWWWLLAVDVVFLLLTALGVWGALFDPNGTSTAPLGLLFLPFPQWLLAFAGLVAVLVGPDRSPRRTLRPGVHPS